MSLVGILHSIGTQVGERLMTSISEEFEAMRYGPAPESADAARAWISEHGPEFDLWIDGAWRSPTGGDRFQSFDPSRAEPIGMIAQAGESDVDSAVDAARAAQPAWEALGGHGRARYLYALARQVQKHSRLLAVLESLDNGKPIRETRDIDVPLVARHFYHHAGWAQLWETEFDGWRPHGVCGQIIPWNFPLLMLSWKIAPALAAGNTVVLKPAEFTSISALAFATLAEAVGLPKGVLNIVTGDGRTGQALVRHPGVDKIAFTGSTDVGREIRRATAGSGKALTLELGGKSPFVVFDDADLDSAVEGVVDAIWFNQGQVCCAGSRLLVQESVAEAFYSKVKARMERLRAGDPLDKAIDIGAIIAPVQLERIAKLCALGEAEGATCWQPSWAVPREGWYFPPTLFTDVAPASTIAQQEIFGPVLAAMTFRSPDEAVTLANDTRFGLAASVWSEDIGIALDIARRIKAGTVWVNCTNRFDAASGFGGYRESGFGREGGREGLTAYAHRAWIGPRSPVTTHESPIESQSKSAPTGAHDRLLGVDRTAKMYIGGKQSRPDGGQSRMVLSPGGERLGEVGEGNRKDIRNAVEAARKAAGSWAARTGHSRAQVLYFIAENLDTRREEFSRRVCLSTGCNKEASDAEVDAAVRGWFRWAAWADKWDGAVHDAMTRGLVLALNEAYGVAAVVCPDEAPLSGLVALAGPLIALGNSVVLVPSQAAPLPATDFYQVLETSDVPGGVLNIVTGARATLAPVLADHDGVDVMWFAATEGGDAALATDLERRSAGNLKPLWVMAPGAAWNAEPPIAERELLGRGAQVKNVWIPHGA